MNSIIFDKTKISAGNFVKISYANSNTQQIIGNVAGVFKSNINLEYLSSGKHLVIVIYVKDIVNGAIKIRWVDNYGINRSYPLDALTCTIPDESSNNGNIPASPDMSTPRSLTIMEIESAFSSAFMKARGKSAY